MDAMKEALKKHMMLKNMHGEHDGEELSMSKHVDPKYAEEESADEHGEGTDMAPKLQHKANMIEGSPLEEKMESPHEEAMEGEHEKIMAALADGAPHKGEGKSLHERVGSLAREKMMAMKGRKA